MKIAFVGKGGSGKTTLSALFCRHLSALGYPVVAIDADINQHLGGALGLEDGVIAVPIGEHLSEIKNYLRGDNPRVPSADVMVKTTPPGSGSRLLSMTGDNPIWSRFGHEVGGMRLLATGAFTEKDLGISCFHSKTGVVELLLNHLVDGAREYVVVDMTAGADAFASGLFTRFDRTFLVCEPTRKAIGVLQQYREYSADFGIALSVIGNKVTSPVDIEFLHHEVGEELLPCFTLSTPVRAMEQGNGFAIEDLEPTNRRVLYRMQEIVDATVSDPARFLSQMHEIHLRNARAWANAAVGIDLASQIDPDFRFGPAVVPLAHGNKDDVTIFETL
jgi:CO dehydrogenase maturation factor